MSYKGIYPGAKVIRGIDWAWSEQDNKGSCSKGKVVQIQDWNEKSKLSGAFVQWENGNKNLYRLGFEGMVSFCIIKVIFKFYKFLKV